MESENAEKITRIEAWIEAGQEKWVAALDVLGGVMFLSCFFAAYWKMNVEWLMWATALVMAVGIGRMAWLAAAIRGGRRQRMPEGESARRRIRGAWISVAWFLLFGLLCGLLMRGASGWAACIPWVIVVVAVAAGVGLLLRPKRVD